jgi:hypothetical protein
MSSSRYTTRKNQDVEIELSNVGKALTGKAKTSLAMGYRPELEKADELDAERLNYYQGLIGVLRWMCELGRLDI